MSWLWPIGIGTTFFDFWTIAHLITWCAVCLWAKPMGASKWKTFWICLGVALVWECFEVFYAFDNLPQLWDHGESWFNSWISDPLTCAVGYWSMWHWHEYAIVKRSKR